MSDPVVRVKQGQLRGRVATTPAGQHYYSFQGVPYAKPPVGPLKFRDPQPVESWEGIRDAISEGNVCPQVDPMFERFCYVGDEDCLFLNVYSPNMAGSLPVMVWIHGGGFHWGSGNTDLYGPDYLVEKDVVVVSINYRCGVPGFLCLNTPEIPGNAGFKDQIQALRWVKENIQNFGGDPNNITIFGESAGAASVCLLTGSPLSKDLINKAVIESGIGLCKWVFQRDPIKNAITLARSLGSNAETVEELYEFYHNTPLKDLVEGYSKISIEVLVSQDQHLFALVVEKEFPGVQAAFTEPFEKILSSGRIADIPIMVGCVSLEVVLDYKSDDLQVFIPSDLTIEKNSKESLAIAEKIKDLYFKGDPKGPESARGNYLMSSHKIFTIDTHRYVKYLTEVLKKPVYYFRFDYFGGLNFAGGIKTAPGVDTVENHALHMDDLGYLFKNDHQKTQKPSPEDLKTRERMVRMWTNFAKTGNPTPAKDEYITTIWKPITKDNLYYMNIGSELTLGTNPDKEQMDFWNEMYQKYYSTEEDEYTTKI